MFEVREPNHTRTAMTRSLGVSRLKLLETKHTLAASARVSSGGTPHAAKAGDDDVECAHDSADR